MMADTTLAPVDLNPNQGGNDENEPPRSHPSNSRRRTKTGCLTCRRRRIKCGEERPICGNCIKSKRSCEGYNQRVVFKAPMQGPMSSISSHSGTLPRTTQRGFVNQQPLPRPAQNPPLPNILPRRQSHDVSTFLPLAQIQGFINNNQSTFSQQVRTDSQEQPVAHHYQGQISWQQYQIADITPLSNLSTPLAHRSPTTNRYLDHYAGNNSSDNQSTPQETPPSAGDSDSSYWAAATSQRLPRASAHATGDMNEQIGYGDEMEEDDDDGPYDVSSDDEMVDVDDGATLRARALQRRIAESNLQTVMTLQAHQDRQDTRVRTYHSVIENYGSDMLATYTPSFKDSPLNDPVAASIFSHFLNVVAPGISMYERHPANPSLLLQEQPVPKSQQHLWAYTLPTVALRNHALMHAMLALSSLHIAKLQNKPTWVSLKHYHYAIRKLAKNVSLPTRRRQLATLATTLLLGYYEVMSADHSKWCDHLLGSQQLVKHIDFAGMTKSLRRRKVVLAQENVMSLTALDDSLDLDGEDADQSTNEEIDENLVGLIMGKKVNYGEMGEVIEEGRDRHPHEKAYTQTDLDLYETQRDLFWWYLKQDTIQSILSQNRLFLNYDRWSHCPPRAPIGRRDAVHGTFDHLILLLGRLSDFASRDLKRKKRATGAPQPRPQRRPTAPLGGSICATNPNNPAAPVCLAGGGPPPGWQGGPPPGWQGPPPQGWTGHPPPELNTFQLDDASKFISSSVPTEECPIAAAAAAAAQHGQSEPMMQDGSGSGLNGPPPGWVGGPPPGFQTSGKPLAPEGPSQSPSAQDSSRQAPPGWRGGPPPGWHGPPPPGWQGPPPGGFGAPPSGPSQDQANAAPSMPPLPPFAGMLPTGERRLPRGFSPDASSPSAAEDSDGCPDGQRTAAEEEWKEIGRAFILFKSQLGPDFHELGPEYNLPIDSPFGPAMQYRGYNIAVIWLLYYMGLIVWHRAHPSQLPSAMVAAGMTAHETREYANTIGRISAGIAPDARTASSVAIATGSGLNDSVFSLFVAGVQYQSPHQRHWVIQRMLDTERLTGWETATQVAKGLETSWIKAAEMGRGPPYERYTEPIPVNVIWDRATQRMDRMFESAGAETHVRKHNTTVSGRAQWAAGVIGIEVGLSRVDINSDDEEVDD